MNEETKQRILELYLCGNDNRIRIIADICGCSCEMTNKVIQDYFDKKIEFTRGNFNILHSSIN